MLNYRYTIIRYVPDSDRMEPINVGVILQSENGIDLRFSPHAAKRGDVDTEAFRAWKQFLQAEVQSPDVPLFRPSADTPEFLRYLESLCDGPVVLSRSFSLSAPADRTFQKLLDSLFERLVLPREPGLVASDPRPTNRFRHVAKERRFFQRGMKSYMHVPLQHARWMAYRQVLNGEFIAVDKVEVARELGRTATEIDKLAHVSELLPEFLTSRVSDKATRYVLLADELKEPFTEQNEDEFDAMSADLARLVTIVTESGGQVIRSAKEAEEFGYELDSKLPS